MDGQQTSFRLYQRIYWTHINRNIQYKKSWLGRLVVTCFSVFRFRNSKRFKEKLTFKHWIWHLCWIHIWKNNRNISALCDSLFPRWTSGLDIVHLLMAPSNGECRLQPEFGVERSGLVVVHRITLSACDRKFPLGTESDVEQLQCRIS